jgi:transcription elongation GreA/GreB family factor
MFFMQPEGQGQSQAERALQCNPTLLVALDYLFWFCYGDGTTDKERLQRFEQGLKLLEPFRCPLIVGDLPDASAAAQRMLTPDEIPSRTALSAANRRLKEWAAARKQTVVIPLSTFMRNATANKELTVHGHTLAEGKTRVLLQDDKLHPSAAGCAVLALAIFDSFLSSQPALSTNDIRWDAKEVYRLAVNGGHASSPSVKSAEAKAPAAGN